MTMVSQDFSRKTGLECLLEKSDEQPQEVAKPTNQTLAWFARIRDRPVFVKWYPTERQESWAKVETAIAGADLHPSIIPLRQRVDCTDGSLLIYDKVQGENLGPQETRGRFQALPVADRAAVVVAVTEALTAVRAAGFMVVDWYEGNMIYDFDKRKVWLFDWELCREGGSFVLETAANYGSSRLMAPEEFVRGSRLDQRTLVFNLGRYALLTLPELADPLAPLLARATYPAQSWRYSTVQEFLLALSHAIAEIASMR